MQPGSSSHMLEWYLALFGGSDSSKLLLTCFLWKHYCVSKEALLFYMRRCQSSSSLNRWRYFALSVETSSAQFVLVCCFSTLLHKDQCLAFLWRKYMQPYFQMRNLREIIYLFKWYEYNTFTWLKTQFWYRWRDIYILPILSHLTGAF